MSDFIGTKVSIPGTNGYGILKYYGPIKDKHGIFGGIELLGAVAAARGKNSGDVDGIQYFEVKYPMTGLFLPFERLKQVNPHLKQVRSESRLENIRQSQQENPRTPSRTSSRNQSKPKPQDALASDISALKLKEERCLRSSSDTSLKENALQSLQPKRNDHHDIETKRLLASLQEENERLRKMNEEMQLELSKKDRVLSDLNDTISQIQPLLEEYENTIHEKESKFAKQKQEFVKAREEWRQSLEILSSNQQEAENFYEGEITSLQKKLDNCQSENIALKDTLNRIQNELGKDICDSSELNILRNQDLLAKENDELTALIGVLRNQVRILEKRVPSETGENETSCQEPKHATGQNEAILAKDFIYTNEDKSSSDALILNNRIRELEDEVEDLKSQLNGEGLINDASSLKDDAKVLTITPADRSYANEKEIIPKEEDRLNLDIENKPAPTANVNTELPIYEPEVPIDPSEGRTNWCGLCERDGHSSLDCPYENDLF